MLKTIHINTEPTWRGGEVQNLLLIRGLKAKGHIADLVCPPGTPLEEKASGEDICVIPMKMLGEVDLIAAFKLRHLLKKNDYDLIHAHTSHAHTLSVLAALGLRTKVIVSRRVDFSIFRRSFLHLNSLKYKHGFDMIITVSKAIRQVLIRDGVPNHLLRVAHSGIDPARFSEEDFQSTLPVDLGIPEDAVLVVNTAHLTPHKGQIHLIRAFPEILQKEPKAFLLIVGQGELRDSLQAEIDKLGIGKHVLLPGFRDDIGAILNNTKIFVMPSIQEGLGTAVLDAFAFSLPVVGTKAGGIPEMIENNKNGILVPPSDPEALSKAVLTLLQNPSLRETIGRNAKTTLYKHFTYQSTVDKTIKIYNEVLS